MVTLIIGVVIIEVSSLKKKTKGTGINDKN